MSTMSAHCFHYHSIELKIWNIHVSKVLQELKHCGSGLTQAQGMGTFGSTKSSDLPTPMASASDCAEKNQRISNSSRRYKIQRTLRLTALLRRIVWNTTRVYGLPTIQLSYNGSARARSQESVAGNAAVYESVDSIW